MGQTESDLNISTKSNTGFKKRLKQNSPLIDFSPKTNQSPNESCPEMDANGINAPNKSYKTTKKNKESNELKQYSIKRNNNNSLRIRKKKSKGAKSSRGNFTNNLSDVVSSGVLQQKSSVKRTNSHRKHLFKNDVELIVRKKLITTTTTLQPIDVNSTNNNDETKREVSNGHDIECPSRQYQPVLATSIKNNSNSEHDNAGSAHLSRRLQNENNMCVKFSIFIFV